MLVDLDWLSGQLCDVLRWQMANPGKVDGPEVPWAGQRVWQLFTALNKTRGSAGFGPLPISYIEIEAYSRLSREPVRPFELAIIRALDVAYLEAAAQRTTPDQEVTVSERQMTPELFDALFG